MRRRLFLLLGSTALVLSAFGVNAAQASTPAADVPTVHTTAGEYWACVALNTVNVGACLGNPLPDPSIFPWAE